MCRLNCESQTLEGGAGGLSRNQNLQYVPLPNRHAFNDGVMWRELGTIEAEQGRSIKSLSSSFFD